MIVWDFRTVAERGITDDHWKRTVSAGDYRAVTYYSALWQPILTDTWDTGDSTTHVNTRMRYDYAGRGTFQSHPVGGQPDFTGMTTGTTIQYDSLGRVIQTAQDSELGALFTYTDYRAGNKVTRTNPRNFATTTTYQAFDSPAYDQPIKVAFAGNIATTTVARDVYGKPTSMTQKGDYPLPGDPNNALIVTHGFAYDTYERLCKRVSPESGQTAFHYDGAGNLEWSAQGVGGAADQCNGKSDPSVVPHRVDRDYDPRNRLTHVYYPGSEPDTSFTYHPDGKLWKATRGGATWTSTYYNRGLLKTDTLTIDSQSFGLSYDYDSLGHLATETYPSNLTINYAPNALGQPTQADGYATGLGYAANGRLTDLIYGNGIAWQASYNTRNLLDTVQYSRMSTLLADRSFVWDANGNPKSITDSVNGTSASDTIFRNGFEIPGTVGTDDRNYQYDSLDRLTRAISGRYGTRHYDYDPVGNLRQRSGTAAGPPITYTYDTDNRLEDLSVGVSFGYDGRGNTNLITGAGGTATMLYNHANELYYDSRGLNYQYDARGWRVKKTAGGSTTYYVYDANHHLVARLKNGTSTEFIHLGSRPIARIEGGTTIYIHTDYQNTPLLETDANATISRTPNYMAYGGTDAEGRAETPGYAGSTPDPATQFDYMGARYYYPIIGRFLSIDPAPLNPMSPVGLNRYVYASANPARFTDPTGRAADDGQPCEEACDEEDGNELPESAERMRRLSDHFSGITNQNHVTAPVQELDLKEWRFGQEISSGNTAVVDSNGGIIVQSGGVAGPVPTAQFGYWVTQRPLNANGTLAGFHAPIGWGDPVWYSSGFVGQGGGPLMRFLAPISGIGGNRWFIKFPTQESAHGNSGNLYLDIYVPRP